MKRPTSATVLLHYQHRRLFEKGKKTVERNTRMYTVAAQPPINHALSYRCKHGTLFFIPAQSRQKQFSKKISKCFFSRARENKIPCPFIQQFDSSWTYFLKNKIKIKKKKILNDLDPGVGSVAAVLVFVVVVSFFLWRICVFSFSLFPILHHD